MPDLVSQLIETFGEQSVLTGEAVSARSSGFLENKPLRAKALLRPSSTEEVAAMLLMCHTAGQPVVPHGGLTNLVHNTSTSASDVALTLERMDAIEGFDPAGGTVTVQAGAPLERVQTFAQERDMFFPLDLAPRGSATIGGLIANNAGGTRVIRYGMMRDMVLGLEVVLADGTVLSSMNRMLKNNTGYDLKHLFIGSEGTLGVITRAVLRLWPRPRGAAAALLGLERFSQAVDLLHLARGELAGGLSSFEVMWEDYYHLTTQPPAPSSAPLAYGFAYYVLLESLGSDHAEEQARLEALLESAYEKKLFADAVVARSEPQRQALWRIRDDSDQMEAQHRPVFSFDVSLPIGAMEAYVDGVRARLNHSFGEVRLWVFGHVGDGNLHLGVWADGIQEADRAAVEGIVYSPLPGLGGSISAEHGIGLEKKAYLPLSRTAEEIETMRRIKAALDPKGILNPEKVF